jgi:hypothetical protein
VTIHYQGTIQSLAKEIEASSNGRIVIMSITRDTLRANWK